MCVYTKIYPSIRTPRHAILSKSVHIYISHTRILCYKTPPPPFTSTMLHIENTVVALKIFYVAEKGAAEKEVFLTNERAGERTSEKIPTATLEIRRTHNTK